MTMYKLVMPEHMNQYGVLFGGNLLKWVDETAWMTVSQEFPGCRFVTIGMDRVVFHKGVANGAILRFEIERAREGRTSVTYTVTVISTDTETRIFSTGITFVRVDAAGAKTPIRD